MTCDSRGQCGERLLTTLGSPLEYILNVLRIISSPLPAVSGLGYCHQGWHDIITIITCHIGLFNNTETIKPVINNRLWRIFKWITLVERKAEINCSQSTMSCPDRLVVFRLDIQFRCSQPGSVFLTPESDDGIGHGGTKQVSVLRQLTPCRNWNNRKYKLYRKWKETFSDAVFCLLQLPFRRRSIVNVSRLMGSAALKQCQSSSPWETSDISVRGGTQAGIMTPSLCIH